MIPNECRRNISHMSKEILAACVDTSCLAQEDRQKYFPNNKEVAMDVLNVLEGIRYHLQKELQLNLNQQDFHSDMTPPNLVDEGDDETTEHIDFDVVTNDAMYNSAFSMLRNVTKTGYEEIP